MMRIKNPFASVFDFTEHLVLVLLGWEELVLQGNGNFRKPGENRDVFPLPSGIWIKWRYDEGWNSIDN